MDEEEAKDYAEDYGAFYQKVSALSNNGLEEIFQKIEQERKKKGLGLEWFRLCHS